MGQVRPKFDLAEPQAQVETMGKVISVWNPLTDRLLELWMKTVVGPPPQLENGKVQGGWPCQMFSAAWEAERKAWLEEYKKALASTGSCGRANKPKSNFSRLRQALETLPGKE